MTDEELDRRCDEIFGVQRRWQKIGRAVTIAAAILIFVVSAIFDIVRENQIWNH